MAGPAHPSKPSKKAVKSADAGSRGGHLVAAGAPAAAPPPLTMSAQLALVQLLAFAAALSLASHLVPQVLAPVYGSALSTSPLAPAFAFVLALVVAPTADALSSASLTASLAMTLALAGAESSLRAVGAWSGALGTWAGPALGWLVVAGLVVPALSQVAQTAVLPLVRFRLIIRVLAALLAAALASPQATSVWSAVPLVSSDRLSACRKLGSLGGAAFAFDTLLPVIFGFVRQSKNVAVGPIPARLVRARSTPLLVLLAALLNGFSVFARPAASRNLDGYPLLASTAARPALGLGLLQVGENYALGQAGAGTTQRGGYRFLRADHSLLGGRWVGSLADRASETGDVGDSIFSAFVLQEAVRLVERPPSPSSDEPESALVVGLGVGIAARSMILHNLTTTVVEYDPAVYAYACEYFALPEPAHVVLEDADGWVQKRANDAQSSAAGPGFTFVIHDVFTGGQVPGELFSVEFWADLKRLMAPTGVLAVNFAAVQHTAGARAVVGTLLASWPQCAGFRDAMGEQDEAEQDGTELRNLVIFCTPFASPSGLTFRPPVPADFHRSQLRQHALSSFASHPVNLRALAAPAAGEEEDELLRRGRAGARLRELQGRAEGEATWLAMRALMPVGVWARW